MSKLQDVKIGSKFGKLTIVEDLGRIIKENTKTKMHYVKCICECGNEVIVPLTHLNTGRIKSCGCFAKETTSKRMKKFNEYYICNNITFVKFSNINEYFICDTEDWHKLKNYCWRKDAGGYAITGNSTKFHRMVMNCPYSLEVDHIIPVKYGDICDNRKSNLNIVTHKENMEKMYPTYKNKSGYINVYYDKERNKWTSQITNNGERIYLGRFNKKEDAIKARKEAEEKYYKYKASIRGDTNE